MLLEMKWTNLSESDSVFQSRSFLCPCERIIHTLSGENKWIGVSQSLIFSSWPGGSHVRARGFCSVYLACVCAEVVEERDGAEWIKSYLVIFCYWLYSIDQSTILNRRWITLSFACFRGCDCLGIRIWNFTIFVGCIVQAFSSLAKGFGGACRVGRLCHPSPIF